MNGRGVYLESAAGRVSIERQRFEDRLIGMAFKLHGAGKLHHADRQRRVFQNVPQMVRIQRRLIRAGNLRMCIVLKCCCEAELRSAARYQAVLQVKSMCRRVEFRLEAMNYGVEILEMNLSICVA